MSRLNLTIISILLVGAIATSVWSMDSKTPRTITTTGNAEIKVQPDEVVLTLGVETKDIAVAQAKKLNDDIVRKIMDAVKGFKIDSKEIKTDFFNIEPQHENNYPKKVFVGYLVRKNVVIKITDISRFEEILSSALVSGANYVHGIEFRTTELRKNRDQARILAIKAAKEKAIAMAKELGESIDKPLSISEGWSDYRSWYGSGWWSGSSSGTMSQNISQAARSSGDTGESVLAPGQISVTANVNVTFLLK